MSVRSGTLAGMRPALRPGLLPLWRDSDTIQIGVDPRRAVAISGVRAAADVIRMLDGSRDRDQLVAEASRRGVPPGVTERILGLLAAAGAVVDFPADMLRTVPPELRSQLMPVLTAASVAAQDSDGGASLLARRSSCTVQVCGGGPVAPLIADLLTRSGLAAASPDDSVLDHSPLGGPVRGGTALGGPVLGGSVLGGSALGSRGSAGGVPRASQADLLVLVGRQLPAQSAQLLRLRQPYLAVYADEAIGVVGPLVRPGRTACLRCIDLTKAEGDTAWPLILAQLSDRGAAVPSCDAVLASSVAAQAAAQAVAFADRSQLAEATVNATLELVLPSWQWRRRSWQPHPACACGGHGAS